MESQGEIQAIILFSGYLLNIKNIWHFDYVTSYTLAPSIKLHVCYFHLAKGQADHKGPWATLFIIVVSFRGAE